MFVAAIIAFLPAAVLVVAGGALIWSGVRGLRRRSRGRAASVLRLVAGIGTLAFVAVALGPFWSDVQYGIVILPVAALLGAALWNGLLLGAAALADRPSRPR